MNELSIRQGASLPLVVTIKDDDALAATLYVKKTKNSTQFAITPKVGEFINGEADVSLNESDTSIPVGEYIYQITVTYGDHTEIYPETLDCDDDECDFPVLQICESLTYNGVS